MISFYRLMMDFETLKFKTNVLALCKRVFQTDFLPLLMENQKSETKLLKRESMLGKEVGVFKCPLLFLVFFDLEKRGTRSIMWKNQF